MSEDKAVKEAEVTKLPAPVFNAPVTTEEVVQTIDITKLITSVDALNGLREFATAMADSGDMLPVHLQGKVGACMAVAMQALRWDLDPWGVGQKTFVINGTLGYEAQLINSVILKHAPVTGALEFDWYGPWDKVIGKFKEMKNAKGNRYHVPGWSLADEAGCGVKVWATLKGESQPRTLDLLLSQALTRNSTLWASDPKQQLAYLGIKRWARLYTPGVLLGVYSRDEVEQMPPRIVNPQAEPIKGTLAEPVQRGSRASSMKQKLAEKAHQQEHQEVPAPEVTAPEAPAPQTSDDHTPELPLEQSAHADAPPADVPPPAEPPACIDEKTQEELLGRITECGVGLAKVLESVGVATIDLVRVSDVPALRRRLTIYEKRRKSKEHAEG